MIVSAKGRYAIRIMIVLAKREGYTSLKEIAKEEELPYKFAESITTELVKEGLVVGSRGKGGGYKLARPPKEYTAAQILAVTETSLAAVSCIEKNAAVCPRAENCSTLPMWRALDDTVQNFLSGYTLQDLIECK